MDNEKLLEKKKSKFKIRTFNFENFIVIIRAVRIHIPIVYFILNGNLYFFKQLVTTCFFVAVQTFIPRYQNKY